MKSCNLVLLIDDERTGALCLIKHKTFNPYGGVEAWLYVLLTWNQMEKND